MLYGCVFCSSAAGHLDPMFSFKETAQAFDSQAVEAAGGETELVLECERAGDRQEEYGNGLHCCDSRGSCLHSQALPAERLIGDCVRYAIYPQKRTIIILLSNTVIYTSQKHICSSLLQVFKSPFSSFLIF